MEELKKVEDLIDHARDYVNTRVDEVKLAMAEKSSKNALIHQLFNNDLENEKD
jgi:hypothetical protein